MYETLLVSLENPGMGDKSDTYMTYFCTVYSLILPEEQMPTDKIAARSERQRL